ncbi:Fur family transcriptional regulator [Corynebacterium aquatimens]|uniref:Fur family ferric uptake transcriptional regulator n=1 Tax=Corynebacterium aquatimens TaxID=1190508 RepID=A0A931E1K1_9CORY|nr:Fur family transcriptional regulator [Corynebacterium aquatimens]MBG6122076.1 Fur family ferric uptake transcriptional regulator [Corynebacterium aquatimens]WJY65383.1 Zinc uptake regulation protein [Corynebacterium aquatimens]
MESRLPTRSKTPKIGARNTRQRSAVVEVLKDLDRFASAQAIHRELMARGQKVGLTTVYRTLQTLTDIGAVDVLSSNGETVYRHCLTEHHHHHLVCTKCGRSEEIDGGPVEQWAKETAAQHGYQLGGHDAEVFGICPLCASNDQINNQNANHNSNAAE